MNSYEVTNLSDSSAEDNFADRIKLLITRVGSATEIARRCDFSEGVVRSWRDGKTDPSRARCVTLARTLGISLLWLVAGEGALQADVLDSDPAEQGSAAEPAATHSHIRVAHTLASHATRLAHEDGDDVDARRLNAAMRILQSELNLASSPMAVSDNTDLVAELYHLLGPNGIHKDPLAMVGFNERLARHIHGSNGAA